MKALVLEAYNNLVFKDVPDPLCGPDEVIVNVKACGICGSDIHGMDGSTGRRIPPLIMGHEASGVIKSIGANVINWNEGDRVTFDSTAHPINDWYSQKGNYNLSDNRKVFGVSCSDYRLDGAFAEYVAVPQHILYKIPDEVSFNHAAMTEPAAVALHAVNLSAPNNEETAVIIGTGVIGLFLVQILKLKGCRKIIAVDKADHRLRLAEKLGADILIKAGKHSIVPEIYSHTDNHGSDYVFEAVGLESSVLTAIQCVGKGGSVTLIGNIAKTISIPLQWVVTRQIKLQGSCAISGEYPDILDLLRGKKLNPGDMISACAPLSEGAEWFHRLYKGDSKLIKIILNP